MRWVNNWAYFKRIPLKVSEIKNILSYGHGEGNATSILMSNGNTSEEWKVDSGVFFFFLMRGVGTAS